MKSTPRLWLWLRRQINPLAGSSPESNPLTNAADGSNGWEICHGTKVPASNSQSSNLQSSNLQSSTSQVAPQLHTTTQFRGTKLPMYLVLTMPLVLHVVGAVGLVGYFSYRSGQKVIAQLAQDLTTKVGQQVSQEIDHYLDAAQRTNQQQIAAIAAGAISVHRLDQLHRYLLLQHRHHQHLTALAIGTANGELRVSYRVDPSDQSTIGGLKPDDLPYQAVIATATQPNLDRIYATTTTGQLGRYLLTLKNRDVRDRPWYRRAVQTGQSGWSEPFQIGSTNQLAFNAYAPIYQPSQTASSTRPHLLGVFAATISLNQLSEFLRELQVGKTGHVFIIDSQGLLIANSVGLSPYKVTGAASDQAGVRIPHQRFTRLSAENVASPLIQQSYHQIRQQVQDWRTLRSPQTIAATIHGKRHFINLSPYITNRNLNWLIVSTVPEDDFTAEIQQNLFVTGLLCAGALLLSIGSGLFTSQRLTQQIWQMHQAALAIANQDLNQHLSTDSHIQELDALAAAFNQMAGDLQRCIEAFQIALTASEAKFTTIFHASPDPILITTLAEERILEVNNRALEVFGYSREEIIGRTILEIGFWLNLQDREALQTQLIQQGRVIDLETLARHRSGKIITIFLSAELCDLDEQQVLISILRDISDRKQAESILQQTLEELDYHIANSPLATIQWDQHLRVKQWSTQAETIFGWHADEVFGKTMFDWPFIVAEDMPIVECVIDQLLQGRGNVCQNRNYKKDGSIVYCEWYNSVLFNQSGQLISILSLVQDVTKAKQAELALQEAKELAEAANQAKSTFLASMSHELRTPLNIILGFTQILRQNPILNANHGSDLQAIYASGEHLLHLINDILDLSKIEAGKLTLEPAECNLVEFLNSLQTMLAQRALAKGLQLRLEYDNIPCTILADCHKLQQVLINLLSNAIKFTQQGHVTLRVELTAVKLAQASWDERETYPTLPSSSYPPTHYLHFQVEDTGIGIAAEELPVIFDPFVQASAGRKSQQGTGLGLAISQRLVGLMGGQIKVTSVVGQGTTFWFDIPTHVLSTPPSQSTPTEQTIVGVAADQPQYRILVVDDQPINRRLLVKLLQPLGLEIREAANGEEAIATWQTWHPHLIWMDLRMPILDGYEATRRIRQGGKGKSSFASPPFPDSSIPPSHSPIIIAITAQPSTVDCDRALQAGCDDYMAKPFETKQLYEKLAEHLHIQYRYGAKLSLAQPPSPSATLTSKSLKLDVLSSLPRQWIVHLHHTALLCNDKMVEALVQQIATDYPDVAEILTQLAYNFDFEGILKITQPYLDDR